MWHILGMGLWSLGWLGVAFGIAYVLGVPAFAAPFVWASIVLALVTIAMAVRKPAFFGKRPDGTMPWWSYALFLPWHLTVRTTARADRTLSKDGLYTEIKPGWWVGGWPVLDFPWSGETAVLDVTCELPRTRGDAYLCLPTWDATEPTLEDLERGVSWAVEQRAAGRTVLIHCAHGRGRSVTVLCAALAKAGVYPSWEEAYNDVGKRRRVRITEVQRRLLNRWAGPALVQVPTPPGGQDSVPEPTSETPA